MQGSRKSPGAPQGAKDPSRQARVDATRRRDERRSNDRRNRPTLPWKDLFSPLRRARGRRAADRKGYVDRYSKQDVALLLAIFLLNVADAFLTMTWLHRGGREANPVMDYFLAIGPAAFLAQKILVVGFWLILLLVHKNFRFAKLGLYASLAVYSLLLIIHFSLIVFGVEPPRLDPGAQARALPVLWVPRRMDLPMTQILAIGAPASDLNRRDGRPTAE